tara:strand:- start:1207 stop:1821 length:615 start_codon:yes stop_codon:yes gene_type:complete
MIPRIEQKLLLNNYEHLSILEWLKIINANYLYPPRKVISIYLDTVDLRMYYETVEGLIPRKKVRLRRYEKRNVNDLYSIEIKLSNEHVRSKKNFLKKISLEEVQKDGLFVENYGFCFPLIEISYIREYFEVKGLRLTIDKNIQYKSLEDHRLPFENTVKDPNNVIEIKADIKENLDRISNIFNFPRSKFSKYENAITLLKKTNL